MTTATLSRGAPAKSNILSQIMRNEWKLLTRERVLYLALPIYLLMLVYGVMNGTTWKSVLTTNTTEARDLADQGFEKKLDKLDRILAGEAYTSSEDPRNPGALARFKGYELAVKTPSPTAAITVGQSDVVSSYQKVQWKPMFKQTGTDEIENPENLAVGAFDLGFVLIYLYPLLIIALSYNVLSSERENGTQVLLLSQPVSVAQFVLGKILLRGALIIGMAVGISVFGLLAANPDILAQGALWRVATLGIVLLLYGLFWFGLAVVVNALRQKSSTNALIMIASWLALVLVVPATLNLLAKSLYPLPSRIEMVQALRKGEAQAQKESAYEGSYRADLLRKGEEAAIESTKADFYANMMPIERQAEEIASPIFDKFKEQQASQQALAERLKYLSPAVITQISLNELANHSVNNFNDFNVQVERYHQRWRDYFLGPVLEHRLLTRDELRDIPRFHYQPEPDSVVAGRLLWDAIALALFAGLTFVSGFALLRRYSGSDR